MISQNGQSGSLVSTVNPRCQVFLDARIDRLAIRTARGVQRHIVAHFVPILESHMVERVRSCGGRAPGLVGQSVDTDANERLVVVPGVADFVTHPWTARSL